MATRTAKQVPYGLGKPGQVWTILMLVSLALVALGIVAYSRQAVQGEIVTGMRDVGTMGGAPWGLYVVFVVYFVGVSFAGITIAALIRLMNLEHLKPVSRMAELLTVIALILGSLSIMADVGNPLRAMVNLLRYGRPGSPFFGTFSLVLAGYFFASLVYLYLAGRRDAAVMADRKTPFQWFHRLWAAGYRNTPEEQARHRRATFLVALATLPILIAAHSTLGFVFGLQPARPGWYGALQAPGFVALASVSGTGLLIIIAAAARRLPGARERLDMGIFRWLGMFLMFLTAGYLYFMIVEWLTSVYAAPHHEASVTSAILSGEYAWIFWTSATLLAVSFLVLLTQVLTRRYNLSLIVLTGVLVNLAAIGKRYLIVVPSQTHGNLLPYGTGTYSPTWVEYGVVLGMIGLGVALYLLFIKVFPIMEVPEQTKGGG